MNSFWVSGRCVGQLKNFFHVGFHNFTLRHFPNRSLRIDTALLYPAAEWGKASTVFLTLKSSNSLRYANLVTGGTLVLSIVSEY